MKQLDTEKMLADFKEGLKKGKESKENTMDDSSVEEAQERKEIHIEDLLDDLSYNWDRCEVDSFHEYMREGKFDKAKKMLRLDLDENNAQAVLDYFKKKNAAKMELVEIAIKDIPLVLSDQKYLFKYGSGLYTSKLEIFHDEITFYAKDFVPLKKAQQAWVINSIEVAPESKPKNKMK